MGSLQIDRPEDTPELLLRKYLGSQAAEEFKDLFKTVRETKVFIRRWLKLKQIPYKEAADIQRGRYKLYKMPEETEAEVKARAWVAEQVRAGMIVYYFMDDNKNILERSSITRELYESDYKHRGHRYIFLGVNVSNKDKWGNS